MDVTLIRTSVFELPPQKRVGVIVYDGAADAQLWPGPGPDTELAAAYNDDLQAALDLELRRAGLNEIELGQVLRVGRGTLHCDFLLWAATRPPERGLKRDPAPSAKLIEEAALNALHYAYARDVERIAFPALGAGPDELPRADRFLAIARAAERFEAECREQGSSTNIEEILLCEPMAGEYRKASEKLRGRASAAELPSAPRQAASAPRKRAAAKTSTRRRSGLDPLEVAQNQNAPAYSMRNRYAEGEFFSHPRFGVGKVTRLIDQGAIEVRFEDGSERKLVHGRS